MSGFSIRDQRLVVIVRGPPMTVTVREPLPIIIVRFAVWYSGAVFSLAVFGLLGYAVWAVI